MQRTGACKDPAKGKVTLRACKDPAKGKVTLRACKEPAKGFKCKSGVFNENGFGKTSIVDCKGGEYCFAMSCKIGNSTYTYWGFADEENCYKLNDFFAFGFPCHCKFGAKGVQKSNINFMLPEYMAPSPLVSANRGTRANFFVWLMSSAFSLRAFFLAASASLLK
ncbi:hypothetical protein GPALN_003768 [Globodera pallida]|nr:hypothetical protein GPALN_003768 [Globodera pallida]